MPQALAAIASQAALSATGSAVAAAFTSALISTAVSEHQADAASRRAQAAAAAAARNRNITVRSSVAPRRYVLGTARISGPLMYAEFVGDQLQYLDSIVALTQGELSEVLGVYVGDEYIAPADLVANVPTTGKFSVTAADPYWLDEAFNLVAASSVTVAHLPVGALYVFASLETGTEPDLVQTALTVSSVVGDLVTFSAPVTGHVNVRYASTDGVYVDPLKVQWAMGSASQATTTWSGVSTPKWTADHRLRGVSYVRTLKLIDHQLFLAGDSGDVGLVARGPKGVYDPRTDTTLDYTSNPALLSAWWRTLPTADGGLGVPDAWIDWDTVADAANICDELISVRQLDGTGYEDVKRYECHTVLSLDLPAMDNLQVILDSMAGDFPFTGGKYRCYAGAFRSATVTLTDDDVAQEEPISFAPLANDGETPPNIATARFYDGAHGWVETQARPVSNATYIAADGQEEPLELDLLAATDERQANYLMGVRLERRRPALAGTVTVTGKGADLALLDTLQFDLDGYSAIAGKTFEVRRRTNHWNGRYTLGLREIKASTYTLDADRFTPPDAVTVADNSVLFTVDLPVISSVGEQLVRQADGGLISRAVLVWDEHAQASVRERGQIQLRWAAAGAAWVYGSPVAGHETSGTTGALTVHTQVTVQARAINAAGVPSGWAGADPLQIDGTVDAPSVVAGFTSSVSKGRISWVWDRCVEPDYNVTEIRSSDANWGSTSVQPLYRGKANAWPEVVTAAATVTRYARHFNASGLYSSSVASRAQVVADADLVQDGVDAISSSLSLRYFGLIADTAGTVASFSGAATTVTVLKGGADDTSHWTWSKADSGVTSSLAGTTATVSAMSADIGNVTITGVDTRSIYPNVVERFDLAKIKTAAPPGPVDFAATASLDVVFTPNAPVNVYVRFNSNGTVDVQEGTSGGWVSAGSWYLPTTTGIGSSYEMRTTLEGNTLAAGTLSTWVSLGSALNFQLQQNNLAGYHSKTAYLTHVVRNASTLMPGATGYSDLFAAFEG